jgi:phosphoglycerate dehydrogenase-like enzyme
LAARSLLVIGAGRIGQRVIDKMTAFMQVESFDTARDAPAVLEAKVRAADCVSLHIPLTDETRGFLSAERLSWLRDGAVVVNTARGPVIDEDALYAELSANRLRAAIDVFWQEPCAVGSPSCPPTVSSAPRTSRAPARNSSKAPRMTFSPS